MIKVEIKAKTEVVEKTIKVVGITVYKKTVKPLRRLANDLEYFFRI